MEQLTQNFWPNAFAMPDTLTIKNLFWALAILTCATLLNRVWEYIATVLFKRTFGILSTLAALLIKLAGDSMYKVAAKGRSHSALIHMSGLLILAPLSFLGGFFSSRYSSLDILNNCLNLPSSDERYRCLQGTSQNLQNEYMDTAMPVLWIIAMIAVLYFLVRYSTIEILITEYEWKKRMAGPNLSDQERLLIERDFAKVTNKTDYQAIMQFLKEKT